MPVPPDAHINHLLHKKNSGQQLTAFENHALNLWANPAKYGGTPTKKPPTPGTPAVPAVPTDEQGLTGAQRDASIALQNLFESYGLGSLSAPIIDYLKKGYSADTIQVLLQQTPEWKQRFAANDARVKAGLNALTPAEYIATERSYRQIMSQAGLPTGFYDQTSDFTDFLSKDISPTELKARVDTAAEAVNQAPKETVDYFKQWYNTGDMIAYALDPNRAQPLIDQRIKAAEAAGIGKTQGIGLSQQNAELIGTQGDTLAQMQQGVGFVGSEQGTTDKLSQIYGGQGVSQDDLVKEVFLNDQAAAKKRQGLASQERASFNGSGGANATSVTSNTGGQI